MNNELLTRLLPDNSTPLERALVTAAARSLDIPVPLRELWNVDTCPERLLPWLAWALNMRTWDSSWPEAVKRARLRSAVDIHRRKGTAKSVRAVVNSFGAGVALREWWQTTPTGEPHTFSLTLSIAAGAPQDAAFQEAILQVVDQTKPARSHYTLVAGIKADSSIGVLGATRFLSFGRVQFQGNADDARAAS